MTATITLLKLLASQRPEKVREGCQALLTSSENPEVKAFAEELSKDVEVGGGRDYQYYSYVMAGSVQYDNETGEEIDTYHEQIAPGGKFHEDRKRWKQHQIDPGSEIYNLIIPECCDEVALTACRVAGKLVAPIDSHDFGRLDGETVPEKPGICIYASRYLQSLEALRALTGIERLELYNCPRLEDISALASLSGLQELGFAFCGPKQTNTDSGGLNGIDAIAGLSQLRRLIMCDVASLESLTVLRNLTQLITLSIQRAHSLRHLIGIEGLTQLTHLDLETGRSLESLDGLEKLSSLRELRISGAGALSLKPVAALSNLHELTLDDVDVVSLTGIAELDNIETISISNCNALTDVDVLAHLSTLKNLYINDCGALSGTAEKRQRWEKRLENFSLHRTPWGEAS